MSTAARGRATEWEVRDALLAKGFVVTRSAGSKGLADLTAVSIRKRIILYIEVKLGYWPSGQEMFELRQFAQRLAEEIGPDSRRHPYRVGCWILRKDKRQGWRRRALLRDGEENTTDEHVKVSELIP